MKHLNNNEFTKVMENKGNISIVTKEGIYEFTGITKYKVCIEFLVKLKKEYQIEKTGFYVKFNNVVTTIEAQSLYMSIITKEVI